MTDDERAALRELIDAARPYAEQVVGEDFPCHIGIVSMEGCVRCAGILRLRAAIEAAELL